MNYVVHRQELILATATPTFRPKISWKILGTAAPVFPGFDIDISTRIEDPEKPDAVWHRERARQMVKAHPELKELIGQNPTTALYCIAFVALQLAVALALSGQPWWLVLAAAYVLGPWINTNLFFLGHECNHGLVFKRTSWNRRLYTLTTLPMCLSAHHTWWIDHAVHHNDLGSKKDFLTRRRTFFLASGLLSPMMIPWGLPMVVLQLIRSALGLVVYLATTLLGGPRPGRLAMSILAEEHLISGYRRSLVYWAVVYPALCLSMLAGLVWIGGWMPVLYLMLCAVFLSGFAHPWMFGLILANSHFHGHRHYQPSSSYYGWMNRLTVNHGLHTEHHDLAGIPWNRLPEVRQIAPEFYQDLYEIKSYVGLAWQFHFGGSQVQETLFDNENHRNAEKFVTSA
jgi:sphingolipid 4-desaturase/C4-monooxygenase